MISALANRLSDSSSVFALAPILARRGSARARARDLERAASRLWQFPVHPYFSKSSLLM